MVALLFLALAWPAVRSAPRDLPIGAVGPAAPVEQVIAGLQQEQPGAFEVRTYADPAALEQAVLDREVYGGLVLDPAAPTVLTASAASPAVAQVLERLAVPLSAEVRDLRPLPAEDARGAGVATLGLPLAIGGLASASVLVLLLKRRTGAQLLALAGFVGLASVSLAAVTDLWLGSTEGLWATAAALAAGLAAIALPVLGLGRLLGRAGIAVGAAVVMLLGNPLSAVASAPELLPSGWGTLGQLLPPGATFSLLRSLVWFDGAGAGGPLAVLAGWCALGLLLLGAAVLRARRQPGIRSNGEE